MDYQILALDLDGTLTNSKKEITRPTREALIDIQKNGKKVILASGRPTVGVMPLSSKLKLQEYGGYVLSFNGGHIMDCQSGRVIYNRTLSSDIVAPLYGSSVIIRFVASYIIKYVVYLTYQTR